MVGSIVGSIVGLLVGYIVTSEGENVGAVDDRDGSIVGLIVGDRVLHESKPEHIRFNDNISWQNILLKHVSFPIQSIFTSPSFEQIFKSGHESSDTQSISICCVCNA